MVRMYLDDLRIPKKSFDVIVRSFDDFVKWLVIQDMDKVYTFPSNFTYNVHSANPVGKKNIESYLDGYFQHHK